MNTLAQKQVTAYFESASLLWRDVYQRRDLYGAIHQRRRRAVMSLVDSLALPPGLPSLEIGCGAGSTTVALARRGFHVTALDPAESMLSLTRESARQSGLADQVCTGLGDVRHLPFPSATFSLVLAVGVLPWVDSTRRAVSEMVRVLKPGGHLIANVDNRFRLGHVLDPLLWLRLLAGQLARLSGLANSRRTPPITATSSLREFETELARAGASKVWGATLGFGPLTLFGYPILPESTNLKLDRVLQRLADRNIPLVRSAGAHYLVLARKFVDA